MPERPVWMQPNASASAFTRVIDALWGYTAGLQTQNRENNPMQRKGPAPSTRAACVGAREEKWSVVHRPAQSHPTLARDLRKVGLAALCKRRKCLARLAGLQAFAKQRAFPADLSGDPVHVAHQRLGVVQ